MSDYVLDDPDDVPDEDEDDDLDEDEDGEDGEEDDEEEPETWQVTGRPVSAKGQPVLDFGG